MVPCAAAPRFGPTLGSAEALLDCEQWGRLESHWSAIKFSEALLHRLLAQNGEQLVAELEKVDGLNDVERALVPKLLQTLKAVDRRDLSHKHDRRLALYNSMEEFSREHTRSSE